MSEHTIEFWFEFASTYSYPAAMRIAALAAAAEVTLRWRPFLLGPIFKAQGWDTSPFNIYPDKGRYMWRDLERVCGAFDLPFKRPKPFPQEPCRCPRCAVGLDEGWGEEFARCRLSRGIRRWSFHQRAGGDRELVASLGIDPASALAPGQSDPTKARRAAKPRKRSSLDFRRTELHCRRRAVLGQ